MKRKAFVLLSGGIDSSTCLHIADHEFTGRVEAISIDYGQRHKKELQFARTTCGNLGIRHHTLKLDQIIPQTMLTDPDRPLPNKSYSEIEGVSPTYVPFRNGLMLSAITSFVHGEWNKISGSDGREVDDFAEWGVYFGAHAEDAHNWAYPDCTPEFIGAMANAIFIGTYRAIRLHTPLQWMGKADIIRRGTELNVDWTTTWSCYGGGEVHCGFCPTCRARRKGFVDAGVDDPTTYDDVLAV